MYWPHWSAEAIAAATSAAMTIMAFISLVLFFELTKFEGKFDNMLSAKTSGTMRKKGDKAFFFFLLSRPAVVVATHQAF